MKFNIIDFCVHLLAEEKKWMTLLQLLLLVCVSFTLPIVTSWHKNIYLKFNHCINVSPCEVSNRLIIFVFTYWQSNAWLHHPMMVTNIDFLLTTILAKRICAKIILCMNALPCAQTFNITYYYWPLCSLIVKEINEFIALWWLLLFVSIPTA